MPEVSRTKGACGSADSEQGWWWPIRCPVRKRQKKNLPLGDREAVEARNPQITETTRGPSRRTLGDLEAVPEACADGQAYWQAEHAPSRWPLMRWIR